MTILQALCVIILWTHAYVTFNAYRTRQVDEWLTSSFMICCALLSLFNPFYAMAFVFSLFAFSTIVLLAVGEINKPLIFVTLFYLFLVYLCA